MITLALVFFALFAVFMFTLAFFSLKNGRAEMGGSYKLERSVYNRKDNPIYFYLVVIFQIGSGLIFLGFAIFTLTCL